MREDYVPNEKYRNMFGLERNGYGCERVDLYLAQLEVAFRKIREDNRNLKRELSDAGGRPMGLLPPENDMQAQQQEQYIAQLQAQLADEQEQARLMHEQFAQAQEQLHLLHTQLNEEQEQNRRLLAQLAQRGEPGPAQGAPPPPPPSPAVESLLGQITALRSEADELRQQLRRQAAQPVQAPAPAPYAAPAEFGEDKHSLIGKVLVEARAQAEETVRAARQEADQLTRKSRQRLEDIRAEYERIHAQLEDISGALRGVLREPTDTEYKRGEEFAAS